MTSVTQYFPQNFLLALIGCPSASSPVMGSSVALGFLNCLELICTLCKNYLYPVPVNFTLINAFIWLPLALQVWYLYSRIYLNALCMKAQGIHVARLK